MGKRKRRKREHDEIMRRSESGVVEYRCAKCSRWLPASGFWRCSKTRSGVASWCRRCTSETYEIRRKKKRKVGKMSEAERRREQNWRRRLVELRRPIETTLRPKLDIVRLIGRPYEPQRYSFG